MSMLPYTKESYNLLHRGAQALAIVEGNGMRIDTDYLDTAIRRTEKRIKHLEKKLMKSEVLVEWKKMFGRRTNLQSNDQLGQVLFDGMGFTCPSLTAAGRYKTDEKTLGTVDHPFVTDYLFIKKLQKTLSTYLRGVLREVVDGFIHPFFNLHTTQTYRSSSEAINFQNIPVRNAKIKKLVRTAFIARKGHVIVEIDLSGAEVNVAACYHKDPNMIKYLEDPAKDLHRDMASECYLLPTAEVTKEIRYCGKNMFVFPQFYGDWYLDNARDLWEAISVMSLTTVSGVPLKQHLAEQGIKRVGRLDPRQTPLRGSFEGHLKAIEKNFWDVLFPTYKQWKLDWVEAYRKTGWMLTLTGFICQGYMKKNEINNYPVQGSAFHCLLWALTQLVLKDLPRRKMKSLVVGQIHDSIVADVPVEEVDEFIGLTKNIIEKRLRRRWPWLIVPLGADAEVAPVGGSWADKTDYVPERKSTMSTTVRQAFTSLSPGTTAWLAYWTAHPAEQDDMLTYSNERSS